MMKAIPCIFLLLTLTCCRTSGVTKIGFASCGDQDKPQPVLTLAAEKKLDAFIYLGDNIYGDSFIMDTVRAKYKRLGAKKEFQQLAASAKIYATWDDHDYGRNDTGREHPFKKESKEIMLNFFKESKGSARYTHDGIYQTEYVRHGKKTVQLLLLDERTFRSGWQLLDKNNTALQSNFSYPIRYQPCLSPDSTMLGEEQWKWLEEELRKPADIRIICSGTNFCKEFNGYEAWANFPLEQKRLLNLIKETKANGVLIISGDAHYGEISVMNTDGIYSIYDITSSGITKEVKGTYPASIRDNIKLSTPTLPSNKYRITGPVVENHFGMLTIEWENDPIISMQLIDKNNISLSHKIKLSQLNF